MILSIHIIGVSKLFIILKSQRIEENIVEFESKTAFIKPKSPNSSIIHTNDPSFPIYISVESGTILITDLRFIILSFIFRTTYTILNVSPSQ